MMRSTLTRFAIAILAALLLGCFSAATASAKKVYGYINSGQYIDGSGSEKGPFPGRISGLDYDPALKRLLVIVGTRVGPSGKVDVGNLGYVAAFNTDGTPYPFAGPGLGNTVTPDFPAATLSLAQALLSGERDNMIAIDKSGGPNSGNFYLLSPNGNPSGTSYKYGFAADGTNLTGFTGSGNFLCPGVAVGSQGTVWVHWDHRIREFTPAGAPTGTVLTKSQEGDCRAAIDSEGNFYVSREGHDPPFPHNAFKLNPAGETLFQVGTGNEVRAIAVDPSNDDVFLLESSPGGTVISQYDRAGTKLNTFGLGPPASAYGQLAVNDSTGALYAADPGAGSAERFIAYAHAGSLDTPEGHGLASSVAVNQVTGDTYLAAAAQLESGYEKTGFLQRFDSSGAELSCPGSIEHPAGLTVDPTDQDLYVLDVNPAGGAQLRTLPAACGAQKSSFAVDYPAGSALPQPAADSAGNLYYPNAAKDRLEEFDPSGSLLRAFGWDVVASGPGDTIPTAEVQSVKIAALGGTFTLGFGGSSTAPLPYNATAAEVESALNALNSISGSGGSVSASGGTGDASGASPYQIAFGGTLKGENVTQLTVNEEKLASAVGTQLSCSHTLATRSDFGTSEPTSAETLTYRWLRNGVPIAGATASTYTTVAADESTFIQCQAFAENNNGSSTTATSKNAIVAPAPATDPPGTAEVRATVPGFTPLPVGGPGGQTLSCFSSGGIPPGQTASYLWYRDAKPIAGANGATYVVTAADLATPTNFQCAIRFANAAGASLRVSTIEDSTLTTPPPDNPGTPFLAAALDQPSAATTLTSGDHYEVCVTANGDVCKQASGGGFGTEFSPGQLRDPRSVAIGAGDQIYLVDGRLQKLAADGSRLGLLAAQATSVAVNKQSGEVFVGKGAGPSFHLAHLDAGGAPLGEFGEADFGGFAGLAGGTFGITVDPATHDVWVANKAAYAGGVNHIEKFVRTPPTTTVPTTATAGVDLHGAAAALFGTINADGITTVDCHFDWGLTPSFGNTAPCAQGNTFSESEDHPVSAPIAGLTKGSTYYFRLAASNPNGSVSPGATVKFIAQDKPVASGGFVTKVKNDGGILHADVDPNGGNTTYRFEWGPDETYGHSSPPSAPFGLLAGRSVELEVGGLANGTLYHYRLAATNEAGTAYGQDHTFTTFAQDPGTDPCPNAAVRSQGGSSLLLECRGYELVSAANAGGYDVESDQVPGQQPLLSSPRAHNRLLYGLHFGSVPGIAGSPTNFGLDPYLAERGSDGWRTRYVGLPADGMAQQGPFGSPLLATDATLDQFAFGGPGICDPCFENGAIATVNIPLRRPDGSIVEAMTGSLSPSPAAPGGQVAKHFSADGSYFVFATPAKYEPAGKNGFATIYGRSLQGGPTQVLSTLPNGSTIGAGLGAELDLSSDGSRVLIGQLLSTDSKGNDRYHLYMHLGANPKSVDLTPATTTGALFAGMSADGSKVYFTTSDKLLAADTDESADIYLAEVDSAGALHLSLISLTASGPSNDDSCTPSGLPDSWNSSEGDGKCGALAFAGGAGVAPAGGTIYFLSPELLDGPSNGAANQPNLYLAKPGSPPHFIATIGLGPAVAHAAEDAGVRRYPDFQLTPDGRYAVFASAGSLTGFTNNGLEELYRYDSESGEGVIDCASCPQTDAAPSTDTSLSSYGANLTDDGRVFFTTAEPLVLRDANEKPDAYEWSSGAIQLISAATGFEATLLSVSSDGLDAFFFTRDTLAHEDENGSTIKIYDAREGGGFLYQVPRAPCAASDECHGPGTREPAPPLIPTVEGSGRSTETKRSCRKGFVKSKGKCVRKRAHKHRHHKSRQRTGKAAQR